MALAVQIFAGGRAKSAAETILAQSYLERARDAGRALGFAGFELLEVDERKADSFAAVLQPTAIVVALDERGKSLSSHEFSQLLARWRDDGETRLTFLIGGSDGLPSDIKKRARHMFAFGVQTWPHLLVRTMLAEQIYRAITILSGHPYHRN